MEAFRVVSSLAKLQQKGGRECVEVEGRALALFMVGRGSTAKVYAIDNRCYREEGWA